MAQLNSSAVRVHGLYDGKNLLILLKPVGTVVNAGNRNLVDTHESRQSAAYITERTKRRKTC